MVEQEFEQELQYDEAPVPSSEREFREDLLLSTLRQGFDRQMTRFQDSLQAAATGTSQDFHHVVGRQSEAIHAVAESIRMLHRSVADATMTALDDRLSALEDRLLGELTCPAGENTKAGSEQAVATHVADSGAATDPLSELRRAFFAEEAAVEDSPAAEQSAIPKVTSNVATTREIAEEPLPFDVPDFVDPHQLEDAELRRVFLEREALLRNVVGYARRKSQPPQLMTLEDLRSLADALPEELAARVEQTLSRLDQQQRLGELELSLERARVGRQVSQLQCTRATMETNARKLGLTINEEGVIVGEIAAPDASKKKTRRWLGALGFGI